MKWNFRSPLLGGLVLGLLGAAPLTDARAQEKVVPAPGGVVKLTVTAGAVPPPPVSLTLYERHGHVTPIKGKCAHSGGGLIDIVSPTPDTVTITMSGAVVGNAVMRFDLEQCFEVNFDNPKVKKAKLLVEGRVLGLLRGECKGYAEYGDACASILAGPAELLRVCVSPHNVAGKDSLAVNDHDGPRSLPILPGKYVLHQTFGIAAQSDCFLMKRPSAEFAPDPALDPLWINYWEPFHGVNKKDFGFQVTVRVVAE